MDESYDFVGEGTLAGLGLDTATPVQPPTPNRPAMIWVTHELKPWDHGPPGGGVEMTRMLCFEFADGSGGSEWPVDAAWQPPGVAPRGGQSHSLGTFVSLAIVVGLAVILLVGASFVAFRRGQS